MDNLSFAVEDPDDDSPVLNEGTDIAIVDEIREGSLVLIVPTGENSVEIRSVDPEKLDGDEKVYVVTRGDEPSQIVFARVEIEVSGPSDLNATLEEMYGGVRWYYRDFDLPTELTDKYSPGLIILERGFTDASKHRGGFAASHRYLIASPAAVDLSDGDETDPARGLCVMQRDGYFQVLDVVSDGDKTQTTLLHMPDFLVEVLDSDEFTHFEKNLIDRSRGEFDELKSELPVPALTQKETWLDRLSSPLGMDDEGHFFRA